MDNDFNVVIVLCASVIVILALAFVAVALGNVQKNNCIENMSSAQYSATDIAVVCKGSF